MSFKEQAKKFSVDVKPVTVDGEHYTIKKFTAYWMLNIRKTGLEKGDSHPETMAMIFRGGVAEDLSEISDEEILSVPHRDELCVEILKFNDLLAPADSGEADENPAGKDKKS